MSKEQRLTDAMENLSASDFAQSIIEGFVSQARTPREAMQAPHNAAMAMVSYARAIYGIYDDKYDEKGNLKVS